MKLINVYRHPADESVRIPGRIYKSRDSLDDEAHFMKKYTKLRRVLVLRVKGRTTYRRKRRDEA